jgi:hypothetical protein
MPGKGIRRVRRNIKKAAKDIAGRRTENAVYAVLSQGRAMADTMTPVDTSNLINSGYAPQIKRKRSNVTGRVGYTASYAAAVHAAPGTLKGQPRADFGRTSNHSDAGPMRPVAFGGGTGVGDYWDPNAEPGFLTKGFEQIKPRMLEILLAAYKA